MPGKNVKMPASARDFISLGATFGGAYLMFANTPERDLMHQLAYDLPNPAYVLGVDPREFDTTAAGLPNAGYLYDPNDISEFYTDDRFRERDYDNKLNEFSRKIDDAIASGRYPDGSVQRFFLDYAQWNVNKIKNREFYSTPWNKSYSNEFPACGIMNKSGNYGFTPIISDFAKARLAPDNAMLFFSPNLDSDRAAYTEQEIQESMRKVGIDKVNKVAFSYVDALDDVKNTIGTERPATAEQQSILRHKLLGEIVNLKNEIEKIIHVDTKDPIVHRMYDGRESQAEDGILHEVRGYIGDLRALNNFETYLKSAMPVEGFSEYLTLLERFNKQKTLMEDNRRHFDYPQEFEDALTTLEDKLTNLPQEGAAELEVNAYTSELKRAAERLLSENNKFALNPVKKQIPAEYDDKEKRRLADEANQVVGEFKAAAYVTDVVKLTEQMTDTGRQLYEKLHANYLDYLQSVGDNIADFGENLKGLKSAHSSYYSKELNDALDKAIKLCDKESESSPKEVADSIAALKKLVDAEEDALTEQNSKESDDAYDHLEPLSEWVDSNKDFFDNRMAAAERKGVLTDEAVSKQQLYNSREGRINLDDALKKFNTSRLVGKETEEHRLCRESAERLKNLKSELDGIDKKKNPAEWNAKARAVMGEAKICSDLAAEYVEAKKGFKWTFAGRDRFKGAKDLYKEAEALRVGLKKELAIADKYERLRAETRNVQPLDQSAVQKEYNDKRAGSLAREEVVGFIRDEKNDLMKRMDSVTSLYSASQASDNPEFKSLAGEMLKDAAFVRESDNDKLDPQKTMEFFKNLGKYSVDTLLDFVKDAKSGNWLGDNSGRLQMTEGILDSLCEDVVNDYRVRRYNNELKSSGKSPEFIEEHTIDEGKLRVWFQKGRWERTDGLSAEEKQICEDYDEVLLDTLKSQGLTEEKMEDSVIEHCEAYMKQMADRAEGVYKGIYAEKHGALETEDRQKADSAVAQKHAKEAKFAEVRARNAEGERTHTAGGQVEGQVNEINLDGLKKKNGTPERTSDKPKGRKTVAQAKGDEKQIEAEPIQRSNFVG